MGFIAKLVHGSQFLDLNSAPFSLAPGWAPPGVNYTPQMTSGTMANSFAGGELVGEKLSDRAMSIPVQVKSAAASTAQTHAAVSRIDSFLRRHLADKSEKTFFIFAPSNAIPYTPKYGQLFYKYEIKANLSGNLSEQLYGIANINAHYLELNLTFIIAPTSIGERQLVGSATGGVVEHTYGTPGKESRGLMIPPATANLIRNPVGNATTNWSIGGGAITSINSTYKDFGPKAIQAVGSGAPDYVLFDDAISYTAAANYTLSIYARRLDGGAITSADVTANVIIENTGVAATIRHVGNGLYLISATRTAGSTAASNVGMYLNDDRTIIIEGVQLENSHYVSPLCYGDMIDVAWASTAHNSISTRTISRWRVPSTEILNAAAGSLSFRWIVGGLNSTNMGATPMVFCDATTADEFIFYYNGATGTYILNIDAGTAIASGAKTFASGDVLLFHLVWGPGRMEMYLNGASIASGAAYTMPSHGAYFYLGNDNAGSYPTGGTYSDLISWDVALSDTEVLADYNNRTAHFSGGDGLGQVLHPVPWAWFDQGDDITDNDYDASSVWNNFYAGGIPGNYPAETQWLLEINDANFATDQALYFFNQTFRWQGFNWRDNDNIIRNGTAASITTTDGIFGETFIYTPGQYNKNYYAYIRCIDAGSDLRARFRFQPGGSGVAYNGEYFYFTPDAATYKGFVIGPFSPGYQPFGMVDLSESSCAIGYSRTTGSGTLTVDYNMIMPDPLKIYLVFAMTSLSFIVKNKVAYAVTTSGLVRLADAVVTGSIQELVPGVANFIVAVTGNSGVANATARTIGWKIYVTPRWALV